MIVKIQILGCALALVLLPVAFVASTHATSKHALLDKPNWTVGDFWNYNISLTVPDPTSFGPPLTGLGTATMVVNATENLIVAGASYDTYRVTTKTNVALNGFALGFTFEAWYLRSNISLVKSIVNVSFVGLEENYSPPQTMRWPVALGGSWTSTSVVTIDIPAFRAHFVQPTSVNFTAKGPEKITVPAGRFEALPLQKTDTINGAGFSPGTAFSIWTNEMGLAVWRHLSPDNSVTRTLSFWSNNVGAPVRQVIMGDLGFKASSDLQSFRYQAGVNCPQNDGQSNDNSQFSVKDPVIAILLEGGAFSLAERVQNCQDVDV